MRKPDIRQRFSSGNELDIFIREVEPRGFIADCEWANFPPSHQDQAEYLRLVVPRYERKLQTILKQKASTLN